MQDDSGTSGGARRLMVALFLAGWSVIVLWLAYQVPSGLTLATDGFGDQPFVRSTEAQREWASTDGYVYPDELDALGQRFRWTRGRALIALPAVGSASRELVLAVEGWPSDVLRSDVTQPVVHVLANDVPIGSFIPTPTLATYTVTVPPLGGDVLVDLRLSTSQQLPEPQSTVSFTGTTQYPTDLRPHGVRLYSVSLLSQSGLNAPPRSLLIVVALGFVLLPLLLRRLRLRHAVLMGLLASGGLVVVATFARLWLWPSINLGIWVLALAGVWSWWPLVMRVWGGLRLRMLAGDVVSRAVTAAVLIVTALVGPAWLIGFLTSTWRRKTITPNAIIMVSLIGSALLLVIIRWRDVCKWLGLMDVRLRVQRRPATIILSIILLIWAAYMTSVIFKIPYLGNADYADNGVVARNLVQGRGWVVDYVTQFYELNPNGNVTRVQETWPLLQPVWIAPFFAMFGPTVWAAKLPNLMMMALLALLVYRIAATLWDRRVALVAVVLLLLNKFYFRLQIYSTSDLGFALLYLAAAWTLWLGLAEQRKRWLPWSGILIGLMCLQKPSGVVVAFGMGLWALWWLWKRRNTQPWMTAIRHLALRWILPAVIVFSPYIVRNFIEFGKPVYSTESYDAWILEYPGADSESWEQIYSVMTTEGGLPGTGVPDRSWLLRWGGQRVYDKILRQAHAARDYLFPYSPMLGPLSGKGTLMGNMDNGFGGDPSRWLMAGAWFSLVGLLLMQGAQRRWFGLITASFVPYTIFLIVYWHINNEERYFVPLIPVLVMIASSALWWLHDAITRQANGLLRPLALAVTITAFVLMVRPGWDEAQNQTSLHPQGTVAKWETDLLAFAWLRDNTAPDAVVMTRVPWQLNFHAQRPAVMNPNTADLTTLLRIARYYNAQYLLVNAITNNKGEAAIALGGLLKGEEIAGFQQVASITSHEGRTIYIYRFPTDYNNVAPLAIEQRSN